MQNSIKRLIKRVLKYATKPRPKKYKRRSGRRVGTKILLRTKRGEYLEYKEQARTIVHEFLVKYQKEYLDKGIIIEPYQKVFIKNTVSRWGSCSSKKNLNFSYRLALIPLPLVEYIVVHELCHLKEFNHAKSFWDLVAVAIPDYEARKEELRKLSLRK